MAEKKTEKKELAKSTEQPLTQLSAEIMERILVDGDVAGLTTEQRMAYYNYMCNKAGIDPLGKPFEFIEFADKTTGKKKMLLYARKGCAEQLRRRNGISIISTDVAFNKNTIVATCTLKMPDGRTETDIGAVQVSNRPDLDLMKAVTKAKRRATLGICSLGEVEEAHPSEWLNHIEQTEQQPRSTILLEGQTGSMNPTENAQIKPTEKPQPMTVAEVEKEAEQKFGEEAKISYRCKRCGEGFKEPATLEGEIEGVCPECTSADIERIKVEHGKVTVIK